ncbi:hypothetical protein PR048_027476 [Dryococelus australis]|uniref:Uncharacterized protein n=1 Tax=Dryococelus australis TaxID=614101 RepID=A0ABQ9GFK0_9NEOP|nr:hypothetical protein PR048_027476 [Dryococelus australis]
MDYSRPGCFINLPQIARLYTRPGGPISPLPSADRKTSTCEQCVIEAEEASIHLPLARGVTEANQAEVKGAHFTVNSPYLYKPWWCTGQTTRLPSKRGGTDSQRVSLPGFSRVGIVPDGPSGRRVFSGVSRFWRHSILTALYLHRLLRPIKMPLFRNASCQSVVSVLEHTSARPTKYRLVIDISPYRTDIVKRREKIEVRHAGSFWSRASNHSLDDVTRRWKKPLSVLPFSPTPHFSVNVCVFFSLARRVGDVTKMVSAACGPVAARERKREREREWKAACVPWPRDATRTAVSSSSFQCKLRTNTGPAWQKNISGKMSALLECFFFFCACATILTASTAGAVAIREYSGLFLELWRLRSPLSRIHGVPLSVLSYETKHVSQFRTQLRTKVQYSEFFNVGHKLTWDTAAWDSAMTSEGHVHQSARHCPKTHAVSGHVNYLLNGVFRLLASHLGEPDSIPGGFTPQIFACGDRAGRCRWSAGFLGGLPFPQPLHYGAAPYSFQSPSSALKTSMLRVKSLHFPYTIEKKTEDRRTNKSLHHFIAIVFAGAELDVRRRPIMSHTCSMELRSGDLTDQGSMPNPV